MQGMPAAPPPALQVGTQFCKAYEACRITPQLTGEGRQACIPHESCSAANHLTNGDTRHRVAGHLSGWSWDVTPCTCPHSPVTITTYPHPKCTVKSMCYFVETKEKIQMPITQNLGG
jgi:hypothetical protein